MLHMVFDGVFGIDENGVVAPDCPFFSYQFGKRYEGIDKIFFSGKVFFDVVSVGCDGILEIKRIIFQKMEFFQHGVGIFGPENKGVDDFFG